MANNRPFATLNRNRDFTNLRAHGYKVRPCPWMILAYLPQEQQGLRCGWTISKKVGSAVIRNRLKRWCRAHFRQAGAQFSMGLDIHVILLQQPAGFYKELKAAQFHHCLQRGWRQVLKRVVPLSAAQSGPVLS